MDKIIAIVKRDSCKYYKTAPFRPSINYPELPFNDIAVEPNEVYDMVREGFHLMGYDDKNYESPEWNPLCQIIVPGNTVVLKPNLVMDHNLNSEGGLDCLFTQPSIVAAVLDYVVIALKGKGKIIVGDAPMQECDFEKLINESGYLELINYLKGKLRETNIDIELLDFRELRSVNKDGLRYSVEDRYSYSGSGSLTVNLGEDSEFAGLDDYSYKNMRITNYDPALLKKHHNAQVNEYRVSKEILMADVIINMPKPKTHRKGGVTISLKNLVGINSRKEYLPHHVNGSLAEGGDEYLNKAWQKRLNDYLLDKRNYHMQTTKDYGKAKFFVRMLRWNGYLGRIFNKDYYSEGSWYGNDTISRTIIDLNKILLYADKEGKMCKTPQRKLLIVGDMIVSGEKEGPIAPSPKDVGMITMGEDPVCYDEAMATLMGAKVEKIPTLGRARYLNPKFAFTEKNSSPLLVSNDMRYNLKRIDAVSPEDLLYFVPTTGWKPAFKTNSK